MTEQTVNVGLVGAGRIGCVHAGNLAHRVPGVKLAAVADLVAGAAQEVADRYDIALAVQEYERLLEQPDIDAIVICSATNTHSRIIVDAAQAGKHIFCEKPIDFELERIDQALDAVDRAGVKLQIGFNRRFDANFVRVRKAVLEGEIGTPHLMHIISRDPAPPPLEYIKVSGGIFLDMTIHDFDMARYLMGSEVTEVYAAGTVLVDQRIGEAGDLDTTLVTLRFENGAMGVIDNSRQAVYGYDQRAEILGSRGSIAVYNNYPNTAVLSNAQSIQRDLPLNFFMERYSESFVAELTQFVRSVREDVPVAVSGVDGRVAVVMGLAAWKSYEENRPVRLAEIDPIDSPPPQA